MSSGNCTSEGNPVGTNETTKKKPWYNWLVSLLVLICLAVVLSVLYMHKPTLVHQVYGKPERWNKCEIRLGSAARLGTSIQYG